MKITKTANVKITKFATAFLLTAFILALHNVAECRDVTIAVNYNDDPTAYYVAVGDNLTVSCTGNGTANVFDPANFLSSASSGGGFWPIYLPTADYAGTALTTGLTNADTVAEATSNVVTTKKLTIPDGLKYYHLAAKCSATAGKGYFSITVMKKCTEYSSLCDNETDCNAIGCNKEAVCPAAEPETEKKKSSISRGASISMITLSATVAAITINWFHLFFN